MKADFAIESTLILRSLQTVLVRSASVTLLAINDAAKGHRHRKETRILPGRIEKHLDDNAQGLVLASRID